MSVIHGFQTVRKLVASVVVMLLVSACSDSTAAVQNTRGLCDVAADLRSGSVLSDQLLSSPASPGELENRLRGAVALLDDLGDHLDLVPLQEDAARFSLAVTQTVAALSVFGFNQANLVASGSIDQQRPLIQIGSNDVTSARLRLVEALESECGQIFDIPTNGISALNSSAPEVAPPRRTELVPEDLSTEELTTLLASGLGADFEQAILASLGIRAMSDLLEALREDQIALSDAEFLLIAQALRRDDYGDDVALDRLWDACEAEDFEACDLLWYQAPRDTNYETFGGTCGARLEDTESANACVEVFS